MRSYEIKDLDRVIEETGNRYTAIRKISWGDSDKSYYDIRKWSKGSDGSDIPLKGVSFSSSKSLDKLTDILLEEGFGETEIILRTLNKRDDFTECLNNVIGIDHPLYDKEVGSKNERYYDPKDMLGGI